MNILKYNLDYLRSSGELDSKFFFRFKTISKEIVRKQFKLQYFDVDDVMILYVAMHDAFYNL